MTISVPYEFGDIIYLKTDDDQKQRMITEVRCRPGSMVTYELSCGTSVSYHYEFEFSKEKDFVKVTSN